MNDLNRNDSDDLSGKDRTRRRIIPCLIAGVLAVSAIEKFCEGRNLPLWEQYGPWVRENRVQAIALAAAVCYALSLLLDPPDGEKPSEPDGGEPCELS